MYDARTLPYSRRLPVLDNLRTFGELDAEITAILTF
jgi:hypothetical protein